MPASFVRALEQLPAPMRSLAVLQHTQCHECGAQQFHCECYRYLNSADDCALETLQAVARLDQLTFLGVVLRTPQQLEALATGLAAHHGSRRLKQLVLDLLPLTPDAFLRPQGWNRRR